MEKKIYHVSRVYDGSICAKCVRDGINHAFLTAEQKIIVKMLQA